jgi:hypothetical protein
MQRLLSSMVPPLQRMLLAESKEFCQQKTISCNGREYDANKAKKSVKPVPLALVVVATAALSIKNLTLAKKMIGEMH